jgi:NADPH-dependent ferric siderophore reductase
VGTTANPYAFNRAYRSSNLPFGTTGIAEVVGAELIAPRFRRITVAGALFREVGELTPINCTARLFFPLQGENDPLLPSFEGADPEVVFREITTYAGPAGQVIRTWTMRRLDPGANEVDFDFYLREGAGLGLDWGKRAQPGDRVGVMLTKSGAALPGAGIDHQILLGDEAALPHIDVTLKCLREGTRVTVIGEVVNEADHQDLDSDADVEVIWVHRGDAPAGTTDLLRQALRDYGRPSGPFFVQGYAEARLMGDIRRFLREEWGLDRHSYAVSGFWRRGKSLPDQARRGYAHIDAMAAEGKEVDDEEFSKFLEFD